MVSVLKGVLWWAQEWVCDCLCAQLKDLTLCVTISGCFESSCVCFICGLTNPTPHYSPSGSLSFILGCPSPLSAPWDVSLVGEILWSPRLSSQLSSAESSLLFTSIYRELPHTVSSLCWRSWCRHNNLTRGWWVNFIIPIQFFFSLGIQNKTNYCHSYLIYFSPFLFIDCSYIIVYI